VAQPFLGMIIIVPYNFAPAGWAFCSGQIMPISQNTALFSLLGTTYGGNGTTTFALPNLQGRIPLCAGNGAGLTPRVLGEIAGTESASLLINNLPPHTHIVTLNNLAATANAKSGAGNSRTPTGNIPAMEAAGVTATYSSAAADVAMAAGAISVSGTATAALTGSGIPLSIMPPYTTFNYCIALQGIFPSRN
jgi:microcystin-dependent protein